MSFWGNDKWLTANQGGLIVEGFELSALRDGCYHLSVGDEAIVSSEGEKDPFRKLDPNQNLYIQPGQFAYLITNESVRLPNKAMGLINVDTSVKFEGLINISGFHVDAGYKRKLIFAVFNAGPRDIAIYRGQQLFRLWLIDFDGNGRQGTKTYSALPRNLAGGLRSIYPSPFALATRVTNLENELQQIKRQRWNFYIALGAIFLVVAPFIAELYASTFSPWFSTAVSHHISALFQAPPPPSVQNSDLKSAGGKSSK